MQLPFISAGDQGQFSLPPCSAMTASITVLVGVWLASAKKLKKKKWDLFMVYIYCLSLLTIKCYKGKLEMWLHTCALLEINTCQLFIKQKVTCPGKGPLGLYLGKCLFPRMHVCVSTF